ncbi:MAG: hypothetical protein PVF68_05520 [Acidobacteriota bacterium]|jgi:hypothetical protein
MTLADLYRRFPELPADLREEPVLEELAERCGDLLAVARKPSNCSVQHDAANHYYLKLIGPISIYGYGLTSRDRLREQLRLLLERHAEDPDGFATSLLPDGVAAREMRGPGCA